MPAWLYPEAELTRGRATVKGVTLHEEIRDILDGIGNSWLTTVELAGLVNRRGRYRKRDGSPVSSSQIHARTRNYSELFQRSGSLARLVPEHAVLSSVGNVQTPRSVTGLRRQGFKGFTTVKDLRLAVQTIVPDAPGVYLFLRIRVSPPVFLETGTGGFFKGKDPNVPLARLDSEWVEGALVVYVGQAGSRSKGTLRRRVDRMLRFGEGVCVGHWGGRMVWQLEDAKRLVVCWRPVTERDPGHVETALIRSFKSLHGGKRPFANLRD